MAAQVLIEVILEKPHRHAGQLYSAGQKLTVSEVDARFLINNKIIKAIPANGKKSAVDTAND